MGFVKDAANAATFGLAGLALNKKRKDQSLSPQPTMISTTPYEKPISMIGPTRGG